MPGRGQQLCYNWLFRSRKWWNWQTHHLEGVAPKGVGVQVPPSAPSIFLEGRLAGGGEPRQLSSQAMTILITLIHIIVSFFLIVVVLLQSGKSGDIAAAFGGMGSQTAFGPRGAATALSKATTWSAIIFMLTSITLSVFASRRPASNSVLQGIKPSQSKSAPVNPAPPAPPQQK
jgi:preprotein translocase subunit SecG